MRRKEHWERVYAIKGERDLSWFEALPELSLEMLDAAGVTRETCVLDVGGGDSRLIDHLAARGMNCLAVLDVSGAALHRARERLGAAAAVPVWIEADVTGDWTLKPMDVWHDRAAFHFLTEPEDRSRYLARLCEVLKLNGSAIIATFAPDGPAQCSGLPVARYSPESLAETLGSGFALLESRRHVHATPWGRTQAFQYSRFVRVQRGSGIGDRGRQGIGEWGSGATGIGDWVSGIESELGRSIPITDQLITATNTNRLVSLLSRSPDHRSRHGSPITGQPSSDHRSRITGHRPITLCPDHRSRITDHRSGSPASRRAFRSAARASFTSRSAASFWRSVRASSSFCTACRSAHWSAKDVAATMSPCLLSKAA